MLPLLRTEAFDGCAYDRRGQNSRCAAALGAVRERCARVASASGDCQCAFRHGPEAAGLDRKTAAEAAGLDRQALRDGIICYNAHGIEGLRDRWGNGRPARLKPDDLARLAQERFGKPFHPASMSRAVRRLGFSRQKARPSHPLKDPAEAEAFKKSPGVAERYSVHA